MNNFYKKPTNIKHLQKQIFKFLLKMYNVKNYSESISNGWVAIVPKNSMKFSVTSFYKSGPTLYFLEYSQLFLPKVNWPNTDQDGFAMETKKSTSEIANAI